MLWLSGDHDGCLSHSQSLLTSHLWFLPLASTTQMSSLPLAVADKGDGAAIGRPDRIVAQAIQKAELLVRQMAILRVRRLVHKDRRVPRIPSFTKTRCMPSGEKRSASCMA